MSGFSSHPIIPSLFKDMRNPRQFCTMLNWAYIAATIIYLGMGLVGYLMFGRAVSDEITRDLANTHGYPHLLNKVAIWLIIINPLSKFALAARPIVATFELLLGVERSQSRSTLHSAPRSPATQKMYAALDGAPPGNGAVENGASGQGMEPSSSAYSLPPNPIEDDVEDDASTARGPENSPLVGSMISLRAAQRTARWSVRSKVAVRTAVQLSVTVLIGLTAILMPGFEKVMAFLGAFLACATCIFGPLLAKLRLFRHEMTRTRIIMDISILVISFFVAALGTIWSFLPVAKL